MLIRPHYNHTTARAIYTALLKNIVALFGMEYLLVISESVFSLGWPQVIGYFLNGQLLLLEYCININN